MSNWSKEAADLWSREVASMALLRCTGQHFWKIDGLRPPPRSIGMDSMRIYPLNPPANGRRDRPTSTSASTTFWLSFHYFFHPLHPPEGFFSSSPTPAPERSLTWLADKQESANAPFLSGSLWCGGQGDIPIFTGEFGYCCSVITLNLGAAHRRWWWPTRTFLSLDGRMEKTSDH